jgi:hypothetical protein
MNKFQNKIFSVIWNSGPVAPPFTEGGYYGGFRRFSAAINADATFSLLPMRGE